MKCYPSFHLCTFANTLYSKAANDLGSSARFSDYFADVSIFNEHSISSSFSSKYRNLLRPDVRGYGYWIWKPYILLKYATSLPAGSYFAYLDAGFRVNPYARVILNSYFYHLDLQGSILSFSTSPESFHSRSLGSDFRRHLWYNEKYTKPSLISYLGLSADKVYLKGHMAQSGIILARINSSFTDFLREWLRVCETDISFIDDSPYGVWNSAEYQRNENDQSVFSALLHGYDNRVDYSYYDVWPSDAVSQPDWSKLAKTPFHARRERSQYLHHRIIRRYHAVKPRVLRFNWF